MKFAKYSLAFLWIYTGLVSSIIMPGIGFNVLFSAGISGHLASLFVYGGSLLDIAIGIWVLTNKASRLCYQVQIAVILTFTLLLTFIDPSYWLHPFGPLTKNIPILALILILLKQDKDCNQDRLIDE